MSNPFNFGDPIRGESFLDRQREVRRLAGGILKGNSVVITAEPRSGKTSLLYRIQDPTIYSDTAVRIHFCYVDAQTLNGWDVPRFWDYALQPVKKLSSLVEKAYQAAKKENFDTFVLERVLVQLEESGERLVLLLDEFDMILDEPGLHKAEFYGGLRSLSTRYSSFVLVIASRQATEELDRRTQEFNRQGSPYFNFLEEISLGAFPSKDIDELLARGHKHFTRKDHAFLERVSGGHPYFLQATASFLWEAYEDGEKNDVSRRTWAGEQCFQQAVHTLKNIWNIWTPYQQMAFTLAALDAMPLLLPNREFDINRLLKDRPNFAPEQRMLRNRGFLCVASDLDGGYAPQAEIMLWFLVEELTRLLRPKDPNLAAWLREQEWEGLLKHGEKENLQNALHSLKPILKDGALAFIKAAAEGLAGKI